MKRRLRRTAGNLLVLLLLAVGLFVGWVLLQGRPQDLPWAPLDLGETPGLFTGRKLAALGNDFPLCRELLTRAGVRYTALAPLHEGVCGYDDAVRFEHGGARRIAFSPAGVGLACPVAAALAMWEWSVVQPAAQRRFGSEVTQIEHFGSYNCRRIRGHQTGGWSEHASADAIDVAGFRLADGTRIKVASDWRGDGAKPAFLHEVRNGACGLFSTVLSPDYNAAHHDHLHLDQAARGATGWRACR